MKKINTTTIFQNFRVRTWVTKVMSDYCTASGYGMKLKLVSRIFLKKD